MASKIPSPASATLDALAVLERDHRLVERFFADFNKAAPQQLDPIGRRELYATLGYHDYEALDASLVKTITPEGMPARAKG